MVSSPAVQGGRRLQLRVLGFPVHIDLSFPIIMGLLGWQAIRGVLDLVLWLLVAAASVLMHELGHAVVARTTGAKPEIALTGFGGVTTYVPPGPLSRARSLAISLAGPLVGLLAGAALLVVFVGLGGGLGWSGGPVFYTGGLGYGLGWDSWPIVVIKFGLFTCLGWSVLNLLPVVPLDGGQAMRELLPGAPEVRARRAAIVSVLAAVVVAVLAYLVGQQFLALFMLFFGLTNVLALRTPGEGAAVAPPRLEPEQAVVALLWQGAPDQARQVMEELPPGTPIDLAVHGAVLATTGQPEQGFALLRQEVLRRPKDANAAALLVLARALRHDWQALDADLRGPVGAAVPRSVIERAAQEATAVERPEIARWLLAGSRPDASPTH